MKTAYTKLFKGNPNARYFNTIYIDAFAGTGRITRSGMRDSTFVSQTREIQGSAKIALEVQPEFDNYLFIERDKKRYSELQKLKIDYPSQSHKIQIENAEANEFLKQWIDSTDWTKNRAVVFLDPFGMQVEWSLLEKIAHTHAIDVWFLFPIGVAVNRHLTRKEPPPAEWGDRLTKCFGTEEWRTEFYPSKTIPTLFGDEITQAKDTDFARIAIFFVNRLRTIFTGIAENPLLLKATKKNVPLYLLCFATGSNKQSAKNAALRIAQDILGRS